MTKFTFISEEPQDYSKVTFEFQAVLLDTVLSQFEKFLRGSGYTFDGYLGIVEHEEQDFMDEFYFDDAGEKVFSNMVGELKTFNEPCPVCGMTNDDLNTNVCMDRNCPMTQEVSQSGNDAN